MNIDVLVVPDCPNHAAAMARIDEALKVAGVTDVEVTERVIADATDADALGMHGSPTVLIDGHDPFAEPGTPTSVSCRMYRTATGFDGAPSVADLIEAVTSA